jgi:hypothetical protein
MKADDLDPLHKAALELALQMTLKENDAGRVEQVRGMLRDRSRSWLDVATFASYHQQCRNLHLKPWETPPSTPVMLIRLMAMFTRSRARRSSRNACGSSASAFLPLIRIGRSRRPRRLLNSRQADRLPIVHDVPHRLRRAP